MILLPAIDIQDGRCVRLFQGDYAQVTTYDTDPVQVAKRWEEAGASWLHLVDLDGAREGHPVNTELIKAIRAATGLRIEVGGGMRSLAHIEQIMQLGIERIVLGTVAIKDRDLLSAALERWHGRVAVGIDARDGQVAVSGWRETSEVQATVLARELSTLGVQRFIYTDIARDGAMQGPNLQGMIAMQEATPRALIASGGVRSLADLHALAALKVEGAIIGKALYTGDIQLAEAIQELER